MFEAQTAKSIAPAVTFKIRGLRWWIVGLIFLATLINFIDRLTISVLAPVITQQLGLTNLQFASITTWFLVTGGLGFGWLVLWLLLYETPERHSALTDEERTLIQQDRSTSTTTRKMGWIELLKYRQVWAIVLSRFLTDPVWWLYVTWLPLYLSRVRGFSLTQIGLFAWMPYVAADAGSLIGGWASGRLIRHGWTTNKARKAVIIVGAIFMSFGIPAALAQNAMLALFFIGLVTFGFQSWINNVQTMPSDFFPSQAVASVAGLGGLGAGIGAILYTLTQGWGA